MEVRGREPRVRIALHLLVEAGVAVGEVLERDVELRVQRVVERGRLRGVCAHGRVGRLLVDDVVLRPPAAHVVREDDVRGELVAQRAPTAARTRTRARRRSPARGSPRDPARRERRRGCVPRTRWKSRRTSFQYACISCASPRCERSVCSLAVALRARLEQHVVREDRDDVVRPGVLHVHRRERAVRVPGRPALAGVHAAGEVLVAEAEGRGAAKRGRAARGVGEADLDRGRPAVRQRRQGGRRRGEDEEEDERQQPAHADEDAG